LHPVSTYQLRLTEDRLEPEASAGPLTAANRVLYVLAGEVDVAGGGGDSRVGENSAWHGSGACVVRASEGGARVLRYELLADASPPAALREAGGTARLLLEHAIDLDPAEQYLMRCDRVDFEPGGVALPHGHRGGGIRCLIAGALEVTVGDRPARLMQVGDAWFESGREPVLAVASRERPTSFIRVSILPREIRGRSSIFYVNPKDAGRSQPRSYTVFVDEPIEISGEG
jgi:quercetin dioxygenase-like cupin family protein